MTPTGAPPIKDSATQARAQEARLRWRLLYGRGAEDIRARVRLAIGHIRQQMQEPLDLSANPFLNVCTVAAVLYARIPQVLPPAGGEEAAEIVADSGYWQLMQRVQRDTLGTRKMPVRLDLTMEDGEHRFQAIPTPPYLVEVDVHPRRPTVALVVREWMPDPDNAGRWVQVVFDSKIPAYYAVTPEGLDVSDRILDEGHMLEGEEYPWWVDGKPIVPWVFYSAAETATFWDPYAWKEVIEGTLQLGVLYTLYAHAVRAASWSLRYMAGYQPTGADSAEGSEAQHIAADHSTIVQLEKTTSADGSEGQGLIGQWASPTNPRELLDSIIVYEDRVNRIALNEASVSRGQADIRSAASLVVSRDSQRQLQRSYAPLFQRVDLELLSKVSGLMGGPASGWRIVYRPLAADEDEESTLTDTLTAQIEAGLTDRPSAYMRLHPGLTRPEAITALAEIDAQNAQNTGGNDG